MHSAGWILCYSHGMWWHNDEEDDDGERGDRPESHQPSCAGQEDHNEAW